MTITGYLLITDWQAIPYDPCTEYSPFHHPRLYNETMPGGKTSEPLAPENHYVVTLYNRVQLDFNNHSITMDLSPHIKYQCQHHPRCINSRSTRNQTLFLNWRFGQISKKYVDLHLQSMLCFDTRSKVEFCINFDSLYASNIERHDHNLNTSSLSKREVYAHIQKLKLLSEAMFTIASNTCITALDGQCRWMPISVFTGEICRDCPPICRGQDRTLLFPLFAIGMALLAIAKPITWAPTIALAVNQAPRSFQVNFNAIIMYYVV